jgi:hypothetical protein
VSSLPQPFRALVEVPATILGLLSMIVFMVWAGGEAGYPVTDWYPGLLFLLAVLTIGLVTLRGRWADVPRVVRFALIAFAAFTAWSYLTILWANQQGEAWDAANRTLLYLVVFAIFALWSQRGDSAVTLVGAWTLATVGLSAVIFVAISRSGDPSAYFIRDRLGEPAGYPNAAACAVMMALWPAILLASRREVIWPLRAAFAGGAVLLADMALMSQSRGAIFSIPIVLILAFAFLPGRVRTFAVLLVVAPAIAVTIPSVLEVSDQLRAGKPAFDAVRGVTTPVIAATLGAAALVAIGAAIESSRPWRQETRHRVHRGLAGVGVALAIGGAIAGLAVAGNPVTQVDDAWRSFKRGYWHKTKTSGSRLGHGLGSNRYDFYSVAVKTFADHPLIGAGGDNYGQEYLRRGHSDETPRYPHSVELRTLSQTGLIGTVLLLAAIGFMFAAARRATRQRDPLAVAAASAAVTGFGYWLVHGSFDWFWEFAGLGAPAFALAGIAAALVPRASDHAPGEPATRERILRGRLALGVAGVLLGALVASAVLPWFAERDVAKAARTWSGSPVAAFQRLDRASDLNPLSDRAAVVAGSIALRLNDLVLARTWFEKALARDERNSYAILELGAIAADQGRHEDARQLLERAAALSPLDTVIAATLHKVKTGRRVDIAAVNRDILDRANHLVR